METVSPYISKNIHFQGHSRAQKSSNQFKDRPPLGRAHKNVRRSPSQ